MSTESPSNITEIDLRTTIATATNLSKEYWEKANMDDMGAEYSYCCGKAQAYETAARWIEGILNRYLKEHTS